MATLDEERYLRNLLLLGEGTSFVLKSLVVQEESRSGQTLENLLLNNKTLFNGILKEQRDFLYPVPLTANSDLTTWDLSLLLLVVKRLFYPVLPPVIASHIGALKVFRDSIIGHPRKMSMDDTEFLTNQAHVQGHLRNIARYVNQSHQIEDIIRRTATGSIDIESVFRHVNEIHAFSTSLKLFIEEKFEKIKPMLSSLESDVKTIKENVDVIKDSQSDPNDGMKKRLQSLQDLADCSQQDIKEFRGCQDRISQTISKFRNKFVWKTKYDFTKDLNTIIQAECENEKKQKNATDLLFDFVKIIQDENSFDNDEIKMIISQRVEWYGDITFQLLDDLIEWFTDVDKLSDGIGKARLGSIILPIFCSSVTGCFTVLEYVNSSQCKEHLSRISTTVSTLFGFVCSFTLGVRPTSLQSVLAFYWDYNGTESSKKKLKNLVLPIHVTDIKGLTNIWKMFGGQAKKRHLENVSRTLSAMFDEDIRLRTYVDKDQLLETVQETGLLSHSYGNENVKKLHYLFDEKKLEDKQPTQMKRQLLHDVKESRKKGFRPMHSSKSTSNTGCKMTPLDSSKNEIQSSIQPFDVTSNMYRHRVLSKSSYSLIRNMRLKGIKREKIVAFLLRCIPSCMDLVHFVQILDECGYRQLAHYIFLTCMTVGISYIRNSTSVNRHRVNAYVKNVKRIIDDDHFADHRLALRELSYFLYYKRMAMEKNETKRQILADICIAVRAELIDLMALTFGRRLLKDVVFNEIKELVTESSNTVISDVVYLSRLAFANLLAGNFHDGKDILVGAQCRAYNTGPCLERVDMFYIGVCCQLLEFEQNPSKELQKQIILWGSNGLKCLENEDEEIRNLWAHMLVLPMAFCLLGLGNKTNVIENSVIDRESLSQAQYLLSYIHNSLEVCGTMRRKMLYIVAKARICELTDNTQECIKYIKQARKLANDRSFIELISIEKYYERIINETKNMSLFQNQTCQSELCSVCKNDTCSCLSVKDHAQILGKVDDMNVAVTKLVAKMVTTLSNLIE